MEQVYTKNKRKKGGGKKAVIAILLVLAILGGGIAAFFLLGGPEALSLMGDAPTPYTVEDTPMVLEVEPPNDSQLEEAALRDYFSAVSAFAAENDYNTLLFHGYDGNTAFWRDDIFPAPNAIIEQDGFLSKLDPLEILIEEAKGQGLQVWLGVDVFSIEEAANDALQKDISQSLSRLPRKYALAGIVLTGLDAGAGTQDSATYTATLTEILTPVRAEWAERNVSTKLMLSCTSSVDPASAATLADAGLIEAVLPQIPVNEALGDTLASWQSDSFDFYVTQPEGDTSGLLLFFAAATGYDGIVLGSYSNIVAVGIGLLRSALTTVDSVLPTGFDIPQTLEVTYPATATLTWENVYLTGHSNPDEPLLLDGAEVQNRQPNGAWGVYVPLAMGTNTFQLQNGSVSLEKTIERVEPTTSPPSDPREDSTLEAQPGQAIRMATQFVTAMTQYNDITTVNETFSIGGTAIVQESVQFQNGSYLTWAYRLTSGDWVWASSVEWVSSGTAAFTGLVKEEDSRGEYLRFEGTGAPAAYISYSDTGALALTMYDTSFDLPAGFSSGLVSSASVETIENGVVLTLQTANLWGYNMEYEDGVTRLFLKRSPTIGADPLRPLEGVHILLDPGHGESTEGSNYGAIGIAGEGGYPHEKDINLTLAEITAYRLRQLGATVTLTKTDDANPGIYERHALQTELKPDFFISLHHDGLDGNMDLSDRNNLLSFYYHPYSRPNSSGFAQNLMDYISAYTGRNATEAQWGGINYGVIRTTVCPSVLFEYGLIVNPTHYYQSTSTYGLYAAACGTADAILASVPGSGAGAPAQVDVSGDTSVPAGDSSTGGEIVTVDPDDIVGA